MNRGGRLLASYAPQCSSSSYAAICSCEHGHGTGKQIKAYHVAANPNRRQTKEGRASKKKEKEKEEEEEQGAGSLLSTHGRKKILSIDYQSTFGHRVRVRREAKTKGKKVLPNDLRQAVLGNARFGWDGKVVENTSAGNCQSALRLS